MPILHIEFIDETIVLALENVTLSGCNLFFNIIAIEAHNYIKFSPYTTIRNEHYQE